MYRKAERSRLLRFLDIPASDTSASRIQSETGTPLPTLGFLGWIFKGCSPFLASTPVRLRLSCGLPLLFLLLVYIGLRAVPLLRVSTSAATALPEPLVFELGSLPVSDDWGRSNFQPGVQEAPVFAVSALMHGKGILLVGLETKCIGAALEVAGKVPDCPESHLACWQTEPGKSVWAEGNTRAFKPDLTQGTSQQKADVILYYTPDGSLFYPLMDISGVWTQAHVAVVPEERARFSFYGALDLPKDLMPWFPGFLHLLQSNPSSIAAVVSVGSRPRSGVAGVLEWNKTVLENELQANLVSGAQGLCSGDVLSAAGSPNLQIPVDKYAGLRNPSQEGGISFSAQLSSILPGALKSHNYSLIPGGNVRGTAALDIESLTHEMKLEVECSGTLFFAMEGGNEFEFNPPCGGPCDEIPQIPVMPSSLDMFASQDGVVFTHILSFAGAWTIGDQPRGTSESKASNRIIRFSSKQSFPQELLAGRETIRQVFEHTLVALAITVQTPGTFHGRNAFAGLLTDRQGGA